LFLTKSIAHLWQQKDLFLSVVLIAMPHDLHGLLSIWTERSFFAFKTNCQQGLQRPFA
jgi:hypothetical protein